MTLPFWKLSCRIFNERFDLKTGKINTMGILEHLAVEREKEGREKGLQEGLEKGEIKVQRVIENLLSNTEFSDEKIAELANVSIERVKTIREGLSRR
jgi:flagellar biosynthesis/type III secretory pathway protein FliH